MTAPREPGRPGDRELGRRLSRWLADQPDRTDRGLAAGAVQRSKSIRQRPAWLARWSTRPGSTAGVGPVMVAAAAVVLLAVGLGAFGLAGRIGSDRPTVEPSPTVVPSASPGPGKLEGRVLRTVDLERPAVALGTAFGSLWVAEVDGRLLRLDPATGLEQARIDIGLPPCGSIAEAAGSVWVSGCPGGDVDAAVTLRVDPERNVVANRFADVGGDGVGASAMLGQVWFVSDVGAGTITAVDAVTGEERASLSIGRPIRHVTAGFGSLWAAPIGSPEVLRLDPADGRVIATIPLSGDPSVLLTTADAIWVAEPHQWLIGRIEPVSDRLGAEFGAAVGVDQLVAAPNGWIWGLGDREATAVDPAATTLGDRFLVPAHGSASDVALHVLAVDGASLWFADGTSLFQLSIAGD